MSMEMQVERLKGDVQQYAALCRYAISLPYKSMIARSPHGYKSGVSANVQMTTFLGKDWVDLKDPSCYTRPRAQVAHPF